MLYLVPTPIGNLSDITIRAVEILNKVDLILAEDTRVSLRLLQHFKIETPIRSYHDHNEHKILQDLIQQLKSGTNMALISDAGTPGISDPGFLLCRACIQEGIPIECLPGPAAFVPALVNSGLPIQHFHYEGFLPHKKGRLTRLIYLAALPHTFVLYESPHRIKKCILELITHCGEERQSCVCRELTKMHEETVRGTLLEMLHWVNSKEKIKGEIVLVVAGKK
jgi:16S rRNA (cytidine1402-2'-O)-methyltransferase